MPESETRRFQPVQEMLLIPEEREQAEGFAATYRVAQTPVMRDLERSFCGCDYGGTSWTTRKEAELLAILLELAPGVRLLEVGAGSGWPALYLARTTGCDTTLTDIPLEGLRIATRRAVSDGLAGPTSAAVANGAALPFVDGWFDAVSHSDVLCCLDAKLSVLESCRRVIRSEGRMVFTVISIAPGLSAADYARAAERGPPFIAAGADYSTLLERAGWTIQDRIDLTAIYADSVARLIGEFEAREETLNELLGESDYEARLARRRGSLEAIEAGLHRRNLYVAMPAR